MNAPITRAELAPHDPFAAHELPASLPLQAATVMMVDDESIMTDLIEGHLADGGYHSFVATNAPREAMALLRKTGPSLLLLDLMMPEMSGFEILQQVRADPKLKYMPVIVLTAATTSATKLRALELGATEFLAKPVDPSELLLRVRNTLAFQRYRDHLAHHDIVTGLPNREAFVASVEAALADGHGAALGVLHVEVAEVQQVREALGSAAADQFLLALSQRLAHTVRNGDVKTRVSEDWSRVDSVGRMAGDQFALLLPILRDAEHTEAVAKRIIDDMQQAFEVAGQAVFASASVGIAVFPSDGSSAEALMNGANLATSLARQQGKGRYAFFSAELNQRSLERFRLGNQLRSALENGELRLHFQPKVDLRSGSITGAEALIRWQHPELGLLPPGDFIGLAEQLGLIGPIGEWVVREACTRCSEWVRAGRPGLSVAVNVSQRQFEDPLFFGVVQNALQASGIEPAQLVIEITESLLMDNTDASLEMLRQIKVLGIRLSIDDFGTGYSSLSYLKRLPVDELKIDRSFIADLPGGARDRDIVATIASLGHGLGMTVIAEGVETPEQLAAIRTAGCDSYQGFLRSPAVASPEFLRLLLG